jgi:hypothetical protein
MDAVARKRLLSVALVGTAFGLLAVTLAVYFTRGFIPGDALVYLGAGERLNAGHQLYALSPGDRYVGANPPYWTVPILSPPFMGVLLRPLALLPPDGGAYVWWVGTISAIAITLFFLVRGAPILTSIAIIALAIPLTYEIGVGNVNAFILAGAVGIWWASTRGHERAAGVIAAFLVMVKLWPITLAWWLITQRRWESVRAGLAAGLVFAAISLLGAGLDSHLTYLQVVRDTTTVGTSTLSVAGMARYVGVPESIANLLPWAIFIGGSALAWVFRDRPGLSFACAIVAMTLGSSVVNINSFALLLAALAPAAWPAPNAVAKVAAPRSVAEPA